MRRALVTGATGFLGAQVLARRPSNWAVTVFVRPSSSRAGLPPGVDVRVGDLSDPETLSKALEGMDAFLNLASLGFGHAPGIVQAAARASLERCVFVGTTAVFTALPAPTRRIREAAERAVADSGLPYTLLRPTMIYGRRGDRNIERMVRFLRWAPLVPLVAGGKGLQQPVHVDDVADAVWRCLETPRTMGRALNIGGRRALNMAEMVETTLRKLGRRVPVVSLSSTAARRLVALARVVPGLPKLTDEQILRLEEDKSVDNGPAGEAFGYAPISFEEGLDRLLKSMGTS